MLPINTANSAIHVLKNTTTDGTGDTSWKWSLFGSSGGTPTPPNESGDSIISGALGGVKKMESGIAIDGNTGIFGVVGTLINIAVGVVLIYLAISLVIQGVQLGQYGDNPGMRSKTVDNIKRTALAFAILGGLSTIAQLCFNLFV